jgi:hypothetical protein
MLGVLEARVLGGAITKVGGGGFGTTLFLTLLLVPYTTEGTCAYSKGE